MLGHIINLKDNIITLKLDCSILDLGNLINKDVIFKDTKTLVGEIVEVSSELLTIVLIGEIKENEFIYGDMSKPSLNATVRLITKNEIDIILQNDEKNSIEIGKSFVYEDYPIRLDINKFFSNHFAILGNTGSGKSYSVTKILQELFNDPNHMPYKTNIFLFDAYGEYQEALKNIGYNDSNINYKVYTTDLKTKEHERVKIPFWLLKTDDIGLLLNVTTPIQLQVIEKALKLVSYFSKEEESVIKQKNDIISRCLLEIILNGNSPIDIRNKVVSVLSKFHTSTLNLEAKLTQPGWTRTLKQCLCIEKSGKFSDIELVISFLEENIYDGFELQLPDGSFQYGLSEFYDALEFALISEGIFNSEKVYDYANILKIRLNTLLNSPSAIYFSYPKFITYEEYIKSLLLTNDGKKAQIINFNISYIDDLLAKTIVKIFSKIIFNYISTIKNRASFPFHIILEEAHRYIQNDNDTEIFGYNIFDRITKEGRKYGILLGLISQRPSEISETAISQCSNFLVFRMFHPRDIEFVKSILLHTNESFVNRLKALSPGICMIFGNAFKVPICVLMNKPNPEPSSSNCNIAKAWYINN